MRQVGLRWLLCVLVAAAVVLGLASSAGAATTVSGATDGSVPLVIDPASGSATTDLDVSSRPKVAFVVPKVDRVLSYVTIGDFERAPSCTTDPLVEMEVVEHPRADLSDTPGGKIVSRNTVSIGSTPSKLSFSFDPGRMQAGRGYSFALAWTDGSRCRFVRQTTWEHNGAKVDAGTASCQPINPFLPAFGGAGAPSGIWREFHRSGDNDRADRCDNVPAAVNDLPGDMPTGWLASITYSGNDRQLIVVKRAPGASGVFCNDGTNALATLGLEEVLWKYDAATNKNFYVCRFTHWADLGDRLTDGWYYALPLRRAGTGDPRDGYLKVEYRTQDGTAPLAFPAGPGASELFGLSNPAATNICVCYAADPVTTGTGSLAENYVDISVPGVGLGLGVSRSYNSQAAVLAPVGAMGRGWSGSWLEKLTPDATQSKVTITHANGSTVTFQRDALAPGGYAAPPWVQAKLKYQFSVWYYTLPDGTEYLFNATGTKILRVADRNGQFTTPTYDASGFLSKVTDAGGRFLTYESNADGTVKKITTPAGRSVNYTYTAGDLTGVDDLAGKHWTFRYDTNHQLVEITDPRGNSTLNTFDAQNRVTDQVDREANTWHWGYNGAVTTITDPEGSITEEEFANNLLVRRINAKGTTKESTETWAHDGQGNPTRHTDADNKDWLATWSSTGDKLTASDPAGRTTRWTYNATHDPLTEVTPGGLRTDFAYDAQRNLLSTARLSSETSTTQKTTFLYNGFGQLTRETDPLNHATNFAYNAEGDRTSQTTSLGLVTTWGYDADGYLTSTVSPRGNATGGVPNDFKTVTEPDAMGRPLKVTDPLGRVTEFVYDANGNRTKVTDPKLLQTVTTFNKNDQPTEVLRPDLKVEKTSYDNMGQVKTQTDAKQAVTTYGYDAKPSSSPSKTHFSGRVPSRTPRAGS